MNPVRVLVIIFQLVIVVSIFFFSAYSVDAVFRYKYKNRKFAYIMSLAIGIISGTAKEIVNTLEGPEFPLIYEITEMAGYLVLALVLIILLQGKVWRRILAVLMTVELIVTIDAIFSTLREQFAGFFNAESFPKEIFVLLFFLIEAFRLALEFVFLFLISRIRGKKDDTPMPLPLIGIIMVVLQLISSLIIQHGAESDWSRDSGIIRITALLLMLLIFVLFFYIRTTRNERNDLKDLNRTNEELIASQTKFFEAQAKADDEIRSMRHDMKNNIQVLSLLLENGDYDEMRKYLEEMGENLSSADISAHTGDTIADAIIADKKARAKEAGSDIKVSGKVLPGKISPVNMCKILGNLLDNAVEAVSDPAIKELPEEVRVIELQFKKTDNFFMISVANPCSKSPVIEDGRIVTSKADRKSHGFGLHNVETAAKECGGEFTVSCEEKAFGLQFLAEVIIQAK